MASPLMNTFRRAERLVGRPLERAVQSDAAIDAMIRMNALQGDVQRQVERVLRAYLHLFNVPALTDVRRLSRQMSYLERRVRELSRELDEQPVDGATPHQEERHA